MALNAQHERNNITTQDGFGKEGYYGDFGQEKDVEAGATQPRKMSRIDRPIANSIAGQQAGMDSDSDASISVGKQMELEAGNAIKYRTCSWQKVSWRIDEVEVANTQQTAALLFSEYICLAIMSFPYSYAILGLVPGLIMTVVVAGLVLYTSLTVW